MSHKRIIKHITDINNNIKNDKDRLSNIINILNTGKDNTTINDKLIDTLTNIEFEDRTLAMANEYISIIFTNIQTQKITYNKEVTEELVKILNHNLSLLDAIERCVAIFDKNTDKDVPLERRIGVMDTNYKRRVTDDKPKNILSMMIPNNKVSNTLFWASITTVMLTIGYIVDHNIYDHAKDTTTMLHTAINAKPTTNTPVSDTSTSKPTNKGGNDE